MASGLVSVACPACKQVHALPAHLAGTAFTCPTCRAAFVVPRLAPSPAPPHVAIPVGPRPPHLGAVPPATPPPPLATAAVAEAPVVHAPARSAIAGRFFAQVVTGIMLGLLALAIVGGVSLSVRYLRKQRAAPRALRDPDTVDHNPVFVEEGNPESTNESNPPPSPGATAGLPSSSATAGLSSSADSAGLPSTGATAGSSSTGATAGLPSSAAAINPRAPLDGPPRGATWTSAAHEPGITRGGIRVRVQRAEFGEVLARDDRNHPITAGPGDFLKIYIQIENRTDFPVRYVSWFGNQFAAERKQVAARLWDDTGKPYPQQRFDQHRGIQGHTPETTFAKAEFVRDVVIFAVPRSTVESPQRTFRLELPGGAVGRQDFYRFEFKVD